jgi:uncharacterized lipoprotein YddW (UPF0748 family)
MSGRRIIGILLALAIAACVLAQQPPKREFRAAWVATVTNLDWPSSPGLSVATQQSQLTGILDGLQASGINVIVFQIRTECDALYASPVDPWSYYLTGTQGAPPSPFYDPLEFALREAHKRGMELHAWFNPYRARRQQSGYTPAANHVTVAHPDWVITCPDNYKLLDPGLPMVRDYVAGIVADVVRRYDIDGVHFDDYFYPYPEHNFTNQDETTWQTYPRGFVDKSSWRRDNVNLLMRMVHDSIQAIKPFVKFGISPFGIWRNGVPSGISGLDAYTTIYCDAMAWLNDRSIDYLTPQLYWQIGGGQDYSRLMPWWADSAWADGRHLYPGQAAYRIPNWTASEVPNQIRLNRANPKVGGSVFFRANAGILDNPKGFNDSLKQDFYRYPSLLPVMAWKDTISPYMPRGIRYAETSPGGPAAIQWDVPLTAPDGDTASRYAVYRFDHHPVLHPELEDARNMLAVVGGRTYVPPTPPPGGPYYYIVTALDRNYNESDTSNVLQIAPPPVPVLTAPSDGAGAQPESVTVRWRVSPLASSYHMQLSTDSLFATGLIVNDSTIVDTFRVVRGYPGQASVYWRVRAKNGAGVSAFSAPFRFMTGFPTVALLLSPANSALDQPVMPTFRWGAAQGATAYRLQLALSSTFTSTLVDTSGITDTTFTPGQLEYLKLYFWRVRAGNLIGSAEWSATFRFRTVQMTTVAHEEEIPTSYFLSQNYPNPFNPVTTIRFALPQAGYVTLRVYDLLGREETTLVDADMPAGTFTVTWDASRSASGMYFYRIVAGEFADTKRMMLLK